MPIKHMSEYHKCEHEKAVERNRPVYELRQAGLTYKQLGERFGKTRERARQMVCAYELHMRRTKESWQAGKRPSG